MTVRGPSSRTALTLARPSSPPETCIERGTVTETVTDAVWAKASVQMNAKAKLKPATRITQIVKTIARRRMSCTFYYQPAYIWLRAKALESTYVCGMNVYGPRWVTEPPERVREG